VVTVTIVTLLTITLGLVIVVAIKGQGEPSEPPAISPPFANSPDYILSSYQGPAPQAYYWGYLVKRGGSGCYYVERRNTSGSWLRTHFQLRENGRGEWRNATEEAVFDCKADSVYYQYRVWNGPINGVTGIRFVNARLGRTINMCLGVADCTTRPVLDWNET
jgi:hypothetical protein